MSHRGLAEELEAIVVRGAQDVEKARWLAATYITLKDQGEIMEVMKIRRYNEIRTADICGNWLKSTPEFDIGMKLSEQAFEEMNHARLLGDKVREWGGDPEDHVPTYGQIALFNMIESVQGTLERLASLQFTAEAWANYFTEKTIKGRSVNPEVKKIYQMIAKDEKGVEEELRTWLRKRFEELPRRRQSMIRSLVMMAVEGEKLYHRSVEERIEQLRRGKPRA